jgi:hypothetical protein
LTQVTFAFSGIAILAEACLGIADLDNETQ